MFDGLLIDDYPLVVLPKLAATIGLNEAIILQQVHYWLRKSRHEYDGRTWIYNTLEDWQEQFPFWSMSTIRRTLKSLREEFPGDKQRPARAALLLTGNYNKFPADRTIWYTIDYDALARLVGIRADDHLFKMNK